MEIEEFEKALAALEWRGADFTRKTGVGRNTTSRWLNGRTPVPEWVGSYLDAMLEIRRLYDRFIKPEKPGADGADPLGGKDQEPA